MSPIKFITNKLFAIKIRLYRKAYTPIRANRIRGKERIKVVFLLGNLGAWKTERLYKRMLTHPRFEPLLIIGRTSDEDDRPTLRRYFEEKGYSYKEEDNIEGPMWKKYRPDIIFYQKPYGSAFTKNLKSLFCYIPYAFHNSIEDWAFKTPYLYNCWQIYYENSILRDYYTYSLGHHIYNGYATGTPPMDDLLVSKKSLVDPWKVSKNKKRIIYAPHHSIDPENWWQSSTFLQTGETMLSLAEKYSDKVQWAFKPHPLLRGKLDKIWGKEKTDAYYNRWETAEWSQYENGEYIGLFKHSDAMIHDCGSFLMEYHSTGNPVMYLERPNNETFDQTLNETVQEAHRLHYKGYTQEDIKQFIINVINDVDPRKEERADFYVTHMTPPDGKTACQNIIDCILDPKRASELKK